jgi:hypothetical protein
MMPAMNTLTTHQINEVLKSVGIETKAEPKYENTSCKMGLAVTKTHYEVKVDSWDAAWLIDALIAKDIKFSETSDSDNSIFTIISYTSRKVGE